MLTDHSGLSRFERLLTLFTRVRPGEGRSALLFVLHGFLLLFSYQVVKALREAFMLTKFSAEVRAYAVALIALLLMLLVVNVPFLQPVFNTHFLMPVEWLVVVSLALVPATAEELTKLYLRARERK